MKVEARIQRVQTNDAHLGWHVPIFRDSLDGKTLVYNAKGNPDIVYNDCPYFHLYVTTKDIIKDGDWYLATMHDVDGTTLEPQRWSVGTKPCAEQPLGSKIIATTDRLIIGWGEDTHPTQDNGQPIYLPSINSTFIREYCLAGGIDKVMVKYVEQLTGHSDEGSKYHTIKTGYTYPKVTSKNEITIYKVEEKLYTRDEVVTLLRKSLDATKTKHELFRAIFEKQLDEWIEVNL